LIFRFSGGEALFFKSKADVRSRAAAFVCVKEWSPPVNFLARYGLRARN